MMLVFNLRKKKLLSTYYVPIPVLGAFQIFFFLI